MNGDSMKIEIELSHRERYDIWYRNNFETGMEYNPNDVPDFDDEYYVPTPITKTISLGELDKKLYSDIEKLIILWSNDGTKTAGELTRSIIGLVVDKQGSNIK